MKHPWSGLKNIPRNIWLLSIGTLINRTGMMVLPFIALYCVEELNVGVAESGLVLASFGIGAFVSAPFAGKLSDKIGSARLMMISLGLSGTFLFFYSLVDDFLLFLILSFFWAIISEAFRPASLSFISSQISGDRRKTAFAVYRLAINVGMSIGPVLGGILSTIDFSLLFYFDGATSIAACLFLIFSGMKESSLQPETVTETDETPASKKISVFKNRLFIYFLLALIPVDIVFFQHIGALPLFVVGELEFSKSMFGILMAINTVLVIIVEVPLNDAMRNWKHWKALALGALLAGIGFGILIFAEEIFLLVFSVVIWTFGEMILFPAAGDYVAEISPAEKRGEYMGYFQMTFSASLILGPLFGNKVLDDFGSTILWGGALLLGLISALMMTVLRNRKSTILKVKDDSNQ
ncbi:MAG: MFS transporter [Ignavibacteria bacterium]